MTTTTRPTKTYEGRLIIKWYKNDHGDIRPLTIDVHDVAEKHKRLSQISKDFMEKGCDIRNDGKLPYSVSFDMTERK